ncbi:hypothetical protein M902_0733 [Bacteriovorax sp. BAL6_X]|uniref:hypothetical protein n=1 Tax=Bacteriovorax sp. BAL6_X TaxID=1201290 RepID=UPI000386C6CB|nr:hypothetical protein [Bacteriovorax sp. BAL6_X]EPZ49530.1 hypothetical protein M902_0733 [Bacteriovorax sp. BAL6_X]
MEALTALGLFLFVTIFSILITRWLGAWMLRINEVIVLLRRIDSKLTDESKNSFIKSDV